ncbi:MAG: ClpXP protease specificity-enhancing factor SspB [Pseudomonadota bacterium]
MADIELDYDQIMQNALRHVVKDVLTITADLGETPGDHHFYVEFLTDAPGVNLPDHLKAQYPERMTIVLHHQFDDLDVGNDGFQVTLSFKGVEARLAIPFDAITSFADPSAKFGLRFQEDEDEDDAPALSGDDERPTEQSAGQSSNQSADIAELAPREPRSRKDRAGTDKDETDKAEINASVDDTDEAPTGTADVVSLDAFRKK